jgi:hypothetical protein
MQAQKGEDELAAPALIPRIKRAGLASATPQARDIPQRHAGGIRSAGRASRHGDGTTGPLVSAPRPAGCGQGPTSALCGRVPHMEETRTEKISVNLTPSVLARLDDMRARRRWTRSTAAAVLIEHGLDSEDRMTALAGQATTSQEYTALMQESLGDGGKGR